MNMVRSLTARNKKKNKAYRISEIKNTWNQWAIWKTKYCKSPELNRKKEWKIFKWVYSLRNLWDNIKHTNIIGVPEREDRVRKGTENLLEDTIAEYFPNTGKEKTFRFSKHGTSTPGKNTGVGCHFLLHGIFLTQRPNPGFPLCRLSLYGLSHQEEHRSIYMGFVLITPKQIIIKMAKVKDKKILKALKEKLTSYTQGTPKRPSADFSEAADQKGVAWHIQSEERKKPTTKNTLPSKVIVQIWRGNRL